jgi:Arc/MetJ-type ribon-helix-helix transcriptional regulator
MYQSAGEVIREGLRLLKERDQRLESLRRDASAGFEAVDRSDFSGYGESDFGERAAMSVWVRKQTPRLDEAHSCR